MFAMTVVNFLLFSLGNGAAVATCIVMALNLETEYPLSGKQELVNNTLQNLKKLNIIEFWSVSLPVS